MPTTVKLGSQGSDVALLQKKLNTLGQRLVVDGAFGQKTDDAVRVFQTASHLVVDGVCGPKTWDAIDVAIKALDPALPPPTTIGPPGVDFYDRRKYAAQSHAADASHPEGYPVTDRVITDVTGVCLHQTACDLGERVERYDTVGAHFALTRACKLIWLHDFDRKVAAANGWNQGTISIEINGRYAGVEGKPNTVWDDPSTPGKEQGMVFTLEMAETLRKFVRWAKAEIEREGGHTVRALVAHRQASENRRNDPGSAIWTVAVELHTELNMSDGGIGFVLDDGLPIPQDWDPRCVGIAY